MSWRASAPADTAGVWDGPPASESTTRNHRATVSPASRPPTAPRAKRWLMARLIVPSGRAPLTQYHAAPRARNRRRRGPMAFPAGFPILVSHDRRRHHARAPARAARGLSRGDARPARRARRSRRSPRRRRRRPRGAGAAAPRDPQDPRLRRVLRLLERVAARCRHGGDGEGLALAPGRRRRGAGLAHALVRGAARRDHATRRPRHAARRPPQHPDPPGRPVRRARRHRGRGRPSPRRAARVRAALARLPIRELPQRARSAHRPAGARNRSGAPAVAARRGPAGARRLLDLRGAGPGAARRLPGRLHHRARRRGRAAAGSRSGRARLSREADQPARRAREDPSLGGEVTGRHFLTVVALVQGVLLAALIVLIILNRWWQRLETARFLAVAATPEDTPRVLKLLRDPHPAVHIAAVATLERVDSAALTTVALERLPRLAATVSAYYAGMLRRSRPVVVQLLLKMLRRTDDPALPRLVEFAARLNEPALRERLTALTGHSDPEVRVQAARAIGSFPHADSIAALTRLAGDPTWSVRAQALRPLGMIADPATLPLVRDALRDAEWWVRLRAGLGLTRFGAPGRKLLLEAETGGAPGPREMARLVLGLSTQALAEYAA